MQSGNPFDSIPSDVLINEIFPRLEKRKDALSFASTNRLLFGLYHIRNNELIAEFKRHFPHKYHPYKNKKIYWMREFAFLYQKACAEDYAGLPEQKAQLFIAVKKGDVTAVQRILAENKNFGAEIWDTQDASRYPLSHWVVKSTNQTLKDFYFKQLAVKDWNAAALTNQIAYFNLKENLGEFPATNDQFQTAFLIAIKYGHNRIVKLLLDLYQYPFAFQFTLDNFLFRATQYDNHEAMRLLIERKANVDLPCCIVGVEPIGATPLHIAAKNGNPDTVRLLLSKRANVFVTLGDKHKSTTTPLQLAIHYGHPEVVSLLLVKQATVGLPRYKNELLYGTIAKKLFNKNILVKEEDREKTDILLEHCAKLIRTLQFKVKSGGIRKTDTISALHLAAINGHVSVLRLLLENDQPNIHHEHEYTPLHFAALNGHRDAVRLLLDLGADIKHKSRMPVDGGADWFVTPLTAASLYSHHHIVLLILEHVANLNDLNLESKELCSLRIDLERYILNIDDLDEKKRLLHLILKVETSPLHQLFFHKTELFKFKPSINDKTQMVYRLNLEYKKLMTAECIKNIEQEARTIIDHPSASPAPASPPASASSNEAADASKSSKCVCM